MNKNINLCDILKGHEGQYFYSPLYGDVRLEFLTNNKVVIGTSTHQFHLNQFGKAVHKGEILLFPSKDQRDWNIWLEEQKSKAPKTWNSLVESGKYHCTTVKIDHNGVGCTFSGIDIEKSVLALLKIRQLIEIGYGGNVTNDEWDDINIKKWFFMPVAFYSPDEEIFNIVYAHNRSYKRAIAFHSEEQAKEFLKYPENVELLKDYFMLN